MTSSILISCIIWTFLYFKTVTTEGILNLNITKMEAVATTSTTASFAYVITPDDIGTTTVLITFSMQLFTANNETSWPQQIPIKDNRLGSQDTSMSTSLTLYTPHFLFAKANVVASWKSKTAPFDKTKSFCNKLMFSSEKALTSNNSQWTCLDSTGKKGLKFTFNIDFSCSSPNHFGINCNILCQSQKTDEVCYTCDENGMKICCDGFSGDSCQSIGTGTPETTTSKVGTKSTNKPTTNSPSTCPSMSPANTTECDRCKHNEKIYFWSMIGVSAFGLVCLIIILIIIICCAHYYKRSKRYGYGSVRRVNYRTGNMVYPRTDNDKNGSVQLYERPKPRNERRQAHEPQELSVNPSQATTVAVANRNTLPVLSIEDYDDDEGAQSTAANSITRQYSVPQRNRQYDTNDYSTADYSAIGMRPRGDPPPYGTPASQRPVSYV